jgi:hypothetical protein
MLKVQWLKSLSSRKVKVNNKSSRTKKVHGRTDGRMTDIPCSCVKYINAIFCCFLVCKCIWTRSNRFERIRTPLHTKKYILIKCLKTHSNAFERVWIHFVFFNLWTRSNAFERILMRSLYFLVFERIRMHSNAFKCDRTHLNMSERIQMYSLYSDMFEGILKYLPIPPS